MVSTKCRAGSARNVRIAEFRARADASFCFSGHVQVGSGNGVSSPFIRLEARDPMVGVELFVLVRSVAGCRYLDKVKLRTNVSYTRSTPRFPMGEGLY